MRHVQEDTTVASLGYLGLPGALIALKRNDLDDQFTGGSRLVVGHTFDDSRYQVEASYLWQAPWTATASVSDLPSLLNGTVGNLFSPFTNFGSPPDTRVDYDNFVRIHEVSWFNSEEIDLKGVIFSSEDMAVKLLAGLRHVGISEQFDYYAQPTTLLADPTKVDPTRTPNTVNARTLNDLWGPQIGVIMQVTAARNAWVSLDIKGAICDNGASRDLDATIAGTTYPQNRLWQAAAAYVGDVDVSAFWQPTDGLSVRIGYQLLFIDGLVLACENFNPDLAALTGQTAMPPQDRRGKVLYQGPHLGLELRW
ncbi:MAG: BBP7 family outer membrane beta-barrel protein [Thermoguttaceae bacterium]